MELQQLSDLLFWSWIINLGLLLLSGGLTLLFPGLVYRVHGRLFRLSEEKIAQSLYLLLGVYKVLVTTLLFAPWLATIVIMG